jgi:hypothetical protein
MNPNFNKKQEFNPVSSTEAMFAGKIIEDDKAKYEIESFNGDEVKIKEFLSSKFKRHPKIKDVSVDLIITELKKADVIKPIVIEKAEKLEKIPEHIGIDIKNEGINLVEDEKLKEQLERNSFFKELEKAGIFKNDEEFKKIYEKTLALEKEKVPETIKDYLQFAKAGLIKGGEEEVKKDFEFVKYLEEKFKKSEPKDLEVNKKLKKAKELATITELGLVYGVSELGWYGKNIKMKSACKFNDFKGTDNIAEIIKEDDESSFLGLGLDVTFRGLYSEQFKDKLFILLESIRNGKKTRIKYFKNHNGEMMKEFSVPKIIVFFNINDVKNLVYFIKNIDDPKVKEEFKNSSLKFTVMNQIINQCNKLATFAEEAKNDIFKKYIDFINSIKELAWENPDIAKMLEIQHDDETSKQMDRLIEEFKATENK